MHRAACAIVRTAKAVLPRRCRAQRRVLRLRARKVKHAKHRIANERFLIFNFVNDAHRIVALLADRPPTLNRSGP